MDLEHRVCSRCAEKLPLTEFYFISKKTGKRRGQCKSCMAEVKREQRDPDWMPECRKCGNKRPRVGPGRRLCTPCFNEIYEEEYKRPRGAHALRLKDCPSCGVPRLRVDHEKNRGLCAVCRSVPQSRRTSLKVRFNMSPREYLALVAAQGHVCYICKRKPKSFHIDHRHETPPIIRGAICVSCNTLLGLSRDNSDILRSAASYLEDPPAQKHLPGREANPDKANRYHPLTRSRKVK